MSDQAQSWAVLAACAGAFIAGALFQIAHRLGQVAAALQALVDLAKRGRS